MFLFALTGIANYSEETRSEKLWIPQGTRALNDKEYFEGEWEMARDPSEFELGG